MSVIEASRSGEGLQFGPESKARNDRLCAEQLRIWTAYNLLEKYDDDDDTCLNKSASMTNLTYIVGTARH